MNVFVDTNVLLDVVLARLPHAPTALAVWNIAERRQVRASISAISFNNVHYLLRKLETRLRCAQVMMEMMAVFEVVPLDRSILEEATHSAIFDFEDAIQYYSAVRTGSTHLVTRDRKGFPKHDGMTVVSPADLLVLVGHSRGMRI